MSSTDGGSPIDLRAAYEIARRAFRPAEPPRSVDPRPAHRFFWVRNERVVGQMTLLAHREAFAIVGRHPQCGIALPDDDRVELRHLMVRSVAPGDSSIASARVLDLHTEHGFLLADGSRQTAIFAEGPVALTLGGYALIAFPTGPGREVPASLPPPRLDPGGLDGPAAALDVGSFGPYRMNARPKGSSRITLMPRLIMLGQLPPPSSHGPAPFAVRLERGGRSAQVTLSEADLDAGVVIGRSEVCHAELLRRITNQDTSRVHVLLLREQNEISAYDLASTHGTYRDGAPIRRTVLGGSSVLALGASPDAVRLTFLQL